MKTAVKGEGAMGRGRTMASRVERLKGTGMPR